MGQTWIRQGLAGLLCACLLAGVTGVAMAAPNVPLAKGGTALLPVVVGAQASKRTREAATQLAAYLTRISGATFAVQEGDGAAGIVVGVPADFAKLPVNAEFPGGPYGREDYLLRSDKGGVWLLGATELAVEHAVWDCLYRLGHRQYFPGATWEIVPSTPNLAIAVDARESPDFYARRIWYNWGMMDYNRKPYAEWCARNRHAQGFKLNSGHAYGAIVSANKAAFDAHPEYLALVNGERKRGGDAKFCISNPDLRKLVVDHAVRQMRKNPNLDSISMDPSDGAGWCECDDCAKMGSVSDRALTLANDVAAAINALDLGDKYVGMYAYNRHCAPPTIPVHPKVVISATTAFITGGLSLTQIIEGWQAKGATLGIYDYFSVIAWDWNMPRAAKAARPAGIAASIREFHKKGARFYDCESGDAWGPYGLGYYVGARVMWDIDEADRVDALVDDFLTNAFGPAKAPMSRFYQLIAVDNSRRPTGDLLGRMYRALDEARAQAKDRPDVLARIDDLILYTRYAELYNAYAGATGAAQAKLKDEVLVHSFRMRKTSMVHVLGLWSRMAGNRQAHDPKHPLKKDEPFTGDEIASFVAKGIEANQPVEMGFTPVTFSDELVPSDPLKLPAVALGSFPTVPQGHQAYFTWVPKAPMDIRLKVTVQKVWANKPHKVTLYSPLEVTLEPVAESTVVKPDGQTYDVVLPTPHDGLHRVQIADGGDYTRIAWPDGMPVTLPSGIDTPGVGSHFRGPWTMYFYVPKGTKVVGGWAARIANWAPRISGVMKDGDGNVLLDFGQREPGWFSVPVPPGQDGKLWKFEKSQGTRQLMTVPPFLARNGQELMLPKEVVEQDAR